MKNFVIISLLFLTAATGFAQHSIQAMVFDAKNGLPIELGAVRLLRAADSTLVTGGQTDVKGNFILPKIKPGKYTLTISMVGYETYRQKISMENKNLILKNLQLREDARMLKEVEVRGTAAQMVVKGDTMEYNATAFKTAQNAVVEDLLKRLPGVEISAEGKITVHGQEIKKIRVNGKKFFSDDVEMATKNIPAELVDKVQVLDQKSDMALLTGFEDNDTERIINLTFKANRKKGTFGNITGGAGLDLNGRATYDGNGILNFMDGDAQSTITAGGNNVNTSRSSRGRSGSSNNGGITTTQNIGYNLNYLLNPKLKLGGDASYNHSFNETVNKTNRQGYLTDSAYFSNSNTTSHNDQYSGFMRLEAEWKPDSLNTFLFQPNINYTQSKSDMERDFINLTKNDTTSLGNTSNYGNNSALSGGLGIIYSRKLTSKKGRSFTASLQSSLSQNNSESWNKTVNVTPYRIDSVDQNTRSHAESYSISLRVSYVEPLWNLKNFLETSFSLKNSNNISHKDQYNKDSLGYYSRLDSVYSNNYTNRFYSETLEMNYRYVDKMFNLMFGLKGEPSQSYSSRIYQNGTETYVPREVFNFSPTARLQFNFTKKKFARIDYRGQTEQPSVSQLQPVKNNSNLMFITVGNPELKPDFNQSLRMMYTSFNDTTFSSFNASLWGQITKDALVTNSVYDATGRQYSQTVNTTQTPYNINGSVMFNIPLIQKRLHFNTNTSGGFDERYGYSSRGLNARLLNSDTIPLGSLSKTARYNVGESLSLTYTDDLIEIGLRGSFRYSNTQNNLNPNITTTRDWSGGGTFVIHLPYNINFSNDLNYTNLSGYTTEPQNQLIWNTVIDKSFAEGKGVVSLKVFDILHQQLNIRQIIGDNYIQYVSYNTLPTYFLLSLSYKINDFKGTKNQDERRRDYERFRPDGEHPHHYHGEGGAGNRPQF